MSALARELLQLGIASQNFASLHALKILLLFSVAIIPWLVVNLLGRVVMIRLSVVVQVWELL